MGILARLGRWADGADAELARAGWTIGGSADVAQLRNMPAEVAAAWGVNTATTVDRTTAMRVPAIRRGRQVIAGTIGRQPLVAMRTNADGTVTDVTSERPLLRQPDPTTTLQYVLTWTVDDLIFYGVSWWRVLARDFAGFPTQAERIDPNRVTVDVGRQAVYIDGEPVSDGKLIRFDGPDEGVLAYAADTIATARQLDQAVRRNSDGLPPLDLLTPAEGAAPLSTDPGSAGDGTDRSEVDALLDAWTTARRTRSTAFLNRAVTHQGVGFDPEQLALSDARQQQRAELANLMNLAPRYVIAPSGESMTYSTTAAERGDLVDLSLGGYIGAIEQRLSLGDVTPRGTVVRLDLARFLAGDPATAIDTAAKAVEIGALDAAEVRTDVLGRAPRSAAPPAQPPTPGGPTG